MLDPNKILILDGASGTLLEDQNVKLHPTLWSAIALIDDQPAVQSMHKAYYDAGAEIVSTVTYQASFPGFQSIQTDEKTRETMINAIQLARNAADESRAPHSKFVAASLGPYGAFLCGGQEYTGDYGAVTDQELRDFHEPRYKAVIEGKPDVVLFETIPTLQELQVIAQLVKEAHYPTWVAFSVKTEGTVTLADGTPIAVAVDHAREFPVVGANCFPLKDTSNVLDHFQSCTPKPLIVYPNSGEIYDARTKLWHEPSPKHAAKWEVEDWYSRGARIIGGCCRSDPSRIQILAERAALINTSQQD